MRIIQGLLSILIIFTVGIAIYSVMRQPQVIIQEPISRALAPSQIENVLYNLKSCGFEQITALGTAKSLSATYLNHSSCGYAQAARISFEEDARVRFDGNDAAIGTGEVIQDSDIYNGPTMVYWYDNLTSFSFVNYTSNVTTKANVHYFYTR